MSPNTKKFFKKKSENLEEAINSNRLFSIYETPEKKSEHQYIVRQNPPSPQTPNVGLGLDMI